MTRSREIQQLSGNEKCKETTCMLAHVSSNFIKKQKQNLPLLIIFRNIMAIHSRQQPQEASTFGGSLSKFERQTFSFWQHIRLVNLITSMVRKVGNTVADEFHIYKTIVKTIMNNTFNNITCYTFQEVMHCIRWHSTNNMIMRNNTETTRAFNSINRLK